MRKKIVAGNWKMNLNYEEGVSLFSEIVNMVRDEKKGDQQVIIHAPFIHLNSLARLGAGTVQLGAQNCHHQENGAFTGEISAGMIHSVGATHVLVGHSERRQYFAETDELLAQKTNVALKNGLIPVFCVGETLDERNNGSYFQTLESQLANGLFHLSPEAFAKVIVAYEPVWAIGTGLTATPEQAQDIHAFIRSKIEQKYGWVTADDTTILYGGSCNPGNADALFAQPDIDGGLIGGASLKSRDFTTIVKALNN